MTTKNSPIEELRSQAATIANYLKRAERGKLNHIPKVAEARRREYFQPAIVMDDKVLTPRILWTTIKAMAEVELTDWIVSQMQEKKVDG